MGQNKKFTCGVCVYVCGDREFGYNRATIGNDTWGITWSRDR